MLTRYVSYEIYEGNASSLTNDAMSTCPMGRRELRPGAKISCIFQRKLCDENVAVLSTVRVTVNVHNEKLPSLSLKRNSSKMACQPSILRRLIRSVPQNAPGIRRYGEGAV